MSGPYNPDRKNFAPRFGFAWDIGGNGRTVLRAGGGIMYETVNWESFLALNNSLGLATVPTGAPISGSTTSGGTIATALQFYPGGTLNWNGPGTVFGSNPVNCDPNVGAPCTVMGVDRNLKTPYVTNWTVNIQHSFTPNLVLEVAYVGNHGSRLVGIRDINQPTTGAGWTPAAITNCITGPLLPLLLAAARAAPMLELNKPLAHLTPNSLTSPRSFKWATSTARTTTHCKLLSLRGTIMGSAWSLVTLMARVGPSWRELGFWCGIGLATDSTHTNREYASSDFDIRHRFTLSLTYLLPGRDGFGQLLKGWQLNSIISLYGAQPFGVMDATTDVSGTGELISDRWDFFGNPKDFKSTPVGIPFFGGTSNAACTAKALALDGGTAGNTTYALSAFGCYANGKSILIPPALGTFGTMGRNIFRDTVSATLISHSPRTSNGASASERSSARSSSTSSTIPTSPTRSADRMDGPITTLRVGSFGCSCATPDVAASNPVIGSGGSRAVQLGLKLTF